MNPFGDPLVKCPVQHIFSLHYIQVALSDADGNYRCVRLKENIDLYCANYFRKQTRFMDMDCAELSSSIFQAMFPAYHVVKGKGGWGARESRDLDFRTTFNNTHGG